MRNPFRRREKPGTPGLDWSDPSEAKRVLDEIRLAIRQALHDEATARMEAAADDLLGDLENWKPTGLDGTR